MSWLSGILKPIKKFGKNVGTFEKANEIYREGAGYANYGRGLTEQGLAGLDQLDAQYNDIIGAGGLPQDVNREYDVALGGVSDRIARSRRGYAADILQASRRSGGSIDPNAALAYQIESDAGLQGQGFEAENAIRFERAMRRLENTNALYDRIQQIRAAKLGVGQEEEQRGVSERIQALLAMLDRRKAVGSTLASFGKMFGGGGLTGG